MFLLLDLSFESSQVWRLNLDNLKDTNTKKKSQWFRHSVTGLK